MKKISLAIIILLCSATIVFAYFLEGASQFNAYMDRFERVIRALSHNKNYEVPYRAINSQSYEPMITNNIEDILQELEEIVNNTTY